VFRKTTVIVNRRTAVFVTRDLLRVNPPAITATSYINDKGKRIKDETGKQSIRI
jgi:hypothetical protein